MPLSGLVENSANNFTLFNLAPVNHTVENGQVKGGSERPTPVNIAHNAGRRAFSSGSEITPGRLRVVQRGKALLTAERKSRWVIAELLFLMLLPAENATHL